MSTILRYCIWLSAILLFNLCLAFSIAHSDDVKFGSPRTKPIQIIENRSDGRSVRRFGLEASINVTPGVSDDAMTTHAKALFDTELRRAAEAIAGSDFVLVTFDLGPAVVAGREGRRNFRIVFLREGSNWRHLTRP